MSKKITTFKGLRKRIGKQVNAYFTVKGKVTKVTCNVEKYLDGGESVRLSPINADESAKLKTVGGEGWYSFVVNKAWPHTKMDHCHYLTYCVPTGYTLKHKKKPAKETVKVREVTDKFSDIEVGKKYTCLCKCDGHVCRGPWMIVRTTNDCIDGHESYYLLHNNPKKLDGGHKTVAKAHGFKYGWWIGDVGSEPRYKVELILPKPREEVVGSYIYQGFRVGIEQTDKVAVYEGNIKTPRTTIEGRWKLVEDTGDIFLLSNDPSLDGSMPHSKTVKDPGYHYSWWMGPSDGSNSYYKLSVVNAVAEPEEELPDVGAAVQVTPKDPLERIADALDRIASYLAVK